MGAIIKGDGEESARFAEIFGTAPVWLLQFTGMALDARLLKFDLPDIGDTLGWGSAGYEDARRWPLVPVGTIMAGDPIPDLDRTSFFQDCKALISLSFIESECRLLGTVGVDGEEFEGAALDRGWPGVEGKEVFLVERGGCLDPAVCGEIGE